MMDFLDTLFRYEYFGPILFGVIALLIVIFFIILFFGKKDEQERKLEETRRLELANANAFKEEETSVRVEVEAPMETTVVEPESVPIIEEPIKEMTSVEVNEINPFDSLSMFNEASEKRELDKEEIKPIINDVSSEPLLQPIEIEPLSSFKANDEDVTPIEETKQPEIKMEENPQELKYNFTELASSLAKEIEDLEKLSVRKDENKKPEFTIQDVNVDVTPIKDIQRSNPRPVFSSVFVEPVKPATEESKVEEPLISVTEEVKQDVPIIKTEEIKPEVVEINEEVKHDEHPVIDFAKLKGEAKPNFVKPNIELPKSIEMPMKKEVEKEPESMLNTPDLSALEGESYTIE